MAVAAAGASLVTPATVLGRTVDHPPFQTRPLFDLLVETGPAQNLGSRLIMPVLGGTFAGERLSGTVLPGGADWITRHQDGALGLDVRITLRTEDEQLIYMQYQGVRFTPPGGELYWRVTSTLETSAERYSWLNRIVAVGMGRPDPDRAAYWIYEIV